VALSPYPIGASSATGGTFAPGNYNINYINGLLTVAKAGTNVTVTAPNGPQKAGSLFTVTFSVASQTTQIPTGTVSITALNGFGTTVATCQPSPAPLVNGAGSCQMRINAKGTYTVMGAYSGDPNFTSNSASDTVKITP
jgi:hypothetical protein